LNAEYFTGASRLFKRIDSLQQASLLPRVKRIAARELPWYPCRMFVRGRTCEE
jgi:hypothetical protein